VKFRLAAAALILGAAVSGAQVSPDAHWLTLRTKHFNIRFTPDLEHEARRAAINAERAFGQLSAELVPPKGRVELVISDNVDFTNGYATIFPYNTIVIFAHPPIDAASLCNYNDWNQLVITHELTHIFHLDRARGLWALGRNILGRHPAFFPNAYSPSWMTEGLAVYYESRLTGGGRLEGSFHSMVARGAASTGRIPALPDLSRSSTQFPGGEIVYVYGSLLFDYLSQTQGPESIRSFVERSAIALPFFRGRAVKRAFGVSFEDAWKKWSDSLLRITPRNQIPMPGWRDLTPDSRVTLFPRWRGGEILSSISTGKESLAAFAVDQNGQRSDLGRRNEVQANIPLADGSILFAQPEYLSPYVVRSDLFIQKNGEQRRLTKGARLTTPDANTSGKIVAVQAAAGTTRLVSVSPDGKIISPIIPESLAAQWAEPRWSPDGGRIAAVKISRAGGSQIVVLDSLGKVLAQTEPIANIDATPSWSGDGRTIYFSSDREGAPELYLWNLSGEPRRISSAVTGLMSPEPSPDGRSIASVLYTAAGYHLGIAPLDSMSNVLPMASSLRRTTCSTCVLQTARVLPPFEESTAPIVPYNALETLLPRYWEPVLFSSNGEGTEWGFATSGGDIIGRHAYAAATTIQTRYHQLAGYLAYRYSGLGLPLVDLSVEQSWDRAGVYAGQGSNAVFLGRLDRRDQIAAARLTFVRPRYRTVAQLSVGADLEAREYSTDPDTIFRKLAARYQGTTTFPGLSAAASWSNAQRPALSISREDGVVLNGSARQRWRQGTSGLSTRTYIGSTAAFKSVDLPGFAHHVIALRLAGGYADDRAISNLSVGGISGSVVDVGSGYTVGDSPRTFGIRGFSPSAERGIRAFAGSAEYRFPIAAPGRGIGWLPLFLDRVSGDLFGDAGRAYCPAAALPTAEACAARDVANPWIGSIGAELNMDTGIQRDIPFRFRAGVAIPVATGQSQAKKTSFYLTAGSSF
jgi:hypothetical protein